MTEQDAQNMRDEFSGWAEVLQEAYRQGYTDGQDDERAAVVAWLREAAKKTRTRHAYLSVLALADNIDHGEHRRKVKS